MSEHFRVLVCGSRDYVDRQKVRGVLNQLRAKHGARLLIISGGATGADELAREWAVATKTDHFILYARWDTEGKAAGPIRNKRMLTLGKPHLVVAFSKNFATSRGTSNMIGQAENRKVEVVKYE